MVVEYYVVVGWFVEVVDVVEYCGFVCVVWFDDCEYFVVVYVEIDVVYCE